jgi:hypothetical protein
MCILREDRGGKRTPREITDYVLQHKGVYLVEGFARVLDSSVCERNADIVTSFVETPEAFRVIQGRSDRIVWQTAPAPATGTADVVFLFEMATGYGSPIPQPSGRFDLFINGEKALSFCVSKSNRLWQGSNGVSLCYYVKRLNAAVPGYSLTLDSQIDHEGMASFGLGVLRVPRRLLRAGEPARLEVVPFNRNPSCRWFRLGRVEDILSRVDFGPGLDAVCAGRAYPRLGEYDVYFGDIHTHSAASTKLDPEQGCGTGSWEENLEYAREVAGLDVFSISEHDWQMNDEDWRALQYTTDRYYEPGRFVTLHSFEWTSQAHGHRNVYYLDADHPFFNSDVAGRVNVIDPRNPSPQNLWDELDRLGMPAITIPHHTSSCLFPLSLYDYYSPKYDRLVEIYSSWADAEYAGNPYCDGDDKCPALHVVNFLNAGFRVGFCASSDGHDACPGNAQSPHHKEGYRALYHYLGSGRVAVLARELTREAVFDALYQRRCYATTGEPIVLDFTLDGHPMGSELTSAQVSDEPKIGVAVEACANVDRIEICKNGHFVARGLGMTPQERWDWVDMDFDPGADNYYYVRVTQVDGEMAWASPIWISPKL